MTRRSSTLTVRALRPVVAGIDALGHDSGQILSKVGIPRDLLNDSDSRVPHDTMMTLWQVALSLAGDDQLGLHVAGACPVDAFGLHAYAFRSSATLRDAFRRGCRYQRLIHEATLLVFNEDEGGGVLQHALPGGGSVPRHPAEFLVAVWMRFARMVAGEGWAPAAVFFAHAEPGDLREHVRILRAPLRFASGRTAIQVPDALLDLPNRDRDAGLVGVLDAYAERLLDEASTATTTSGWVRRELADALGGELPSAARVAETLHMSVRTLHRRLRDEGTSFRELLDQLRYERATAYLTDPRFGIADVAFLLGFSEISSFYRAFRRWTGKTPAEYREAGIRHGS